MNINKMPEELKTNNLIIRKYKKGDENWYYPMSIKNRKHLKRYESENLLMKIKSLKDAEKLIEYFQTVWEEKKHFLFGVYLKSDQIFVAQIYVGNIPFKSRQYELGFFVDVDYEAMGYITESAAKIIEALFTDLKAEKIIAECDETNVRSINVIKRCGLRKESIKRENNPDGSCKTTLYFGMTRQDYFS